MAELPEILEATLSPDTQAIQLAQQSLEQAAAENLPAFLVALAAVLADVSKSEGARMAAGLQLKNYLTSKDADVKVKYQMQWMAMDAAVRAHIKSLVLGTLGTENQKLRSASQCVAYIAAAEVPLGGWPELIPTLVASVTSPQSTEQLKEASLDAIGYICEDLDPKYLASQSNEILTAIVQGMRKEEPSNNVRLAATKALLNSLEFTKANFEKEQERHYIMQVVCEATQSNCVAIQVAALQNLVRIMSLYYAHMEAYMGPALFAITLDAMKNEKDEVSLQGIEFWSTVCDEEADLAIEAVEAAESGHPPEQTSRFYVKGAMPFLVPILLATLTKQDELDDEDDWNPCKAAGVCLSLVAGCCEDAILLAVCPFVVENLGDADWKKRDAAVMALGSIMEGPDPEELQKQVAPLVSPLISLMRDEMVQVKDSAAWTIGRVCERCPSAVLTATNLPVLLEALLLSLEGETRVAVNACWALSSLVEAASDAVCENDDVDDPATFALSGAFELIVSKLFGTTDRSDAGSNNLRNSAYEALMDMIKYSAKDCYPVVQSTTSLVVQRLITLSGLSSTVGSERQQLSDIGSLLCATLQSLLRKITKDDAVTISDQVMQVLLTMFSQGGGGVQEDIVMTIGVLVDVLGEDFSKYMEPFSTHLLQVLQNAGDVEVCVAGVGLVGDLCRNLSSGIIPYSDNLVKALVNNLTNASCHRSIKPPVLSALGDMALAMGDKFLPFLDPLLGILSQAAQLQVEKDNYDMIDYQNELRDGCLEAYTGVIQGFKAPDDSITTGLQVVSASVGVMIVLIANIAKDEDRTESNTANALGLLGDLCTTFGAQLLPLVSAHTSELTKLVTEGRRSRVKRTKTVAHWAAKQLKLLQQSPNKAT